MDNYIKRKIIKSVPSAKTQQNQISNIIEHARKQFQSIRTQFQFIEDKSRKLQQVIKELEIRLYQQDKQNRRVLEETPMQKSQLETSVFNRNSQIPERFFQKDLKLGSVEGVDQKIVTTAVQRLNIADNDEKLQQSGNVAKKTKKIRRRI